jgi:hypothetical protein
MGLIDVHHHIIPRGYVEDVGKARAYQQSGGHVPPAIAAWTPEKSIDVMEQNGIATAMTSV